MATSDPSINDNQKKQPKQLTAPQLAVIPKTIRGDTYMVMADAAMQPEDEFVNLYFTTNQAGGIALQPPFEPKMLNRLVLHNNILSQCVEAMSVNIDGTGYEFVPLDEGSEMDKAELATAEAFFNEPFPGLSFISIRRDLRKDVESIGYGFLEILQNVAGDVVGFRNADTPSIRLVKLDDAVLVQKTINRAGKDVEIQYWERERRFVQLINGKNKLFFREFGSSRELDRHTGRWESPEFPVKPEDRATQILMFGVNKDPNSPYYLPRWINQLPSVVGSRKAEEQNLEFFDAGGMPPAIIFIEGGSMVGAAANQLNTYLSAQNKAKGRAVVVELQSSSGSIDSAGKVSAKVERFGSSGTNDAMFANYDKAAEDHVRVGFRLPPLFLGKAADFNFATAQTAYMVAEAQVFEPERREFDQLINKTLLKALGLKTLLINSKPVTLKSVDDQLKGLELIVDKVDGEDFVKEVNKIVGTNLDYSQEAVDAAAEANKPMLTPEPLPLPLPKGSKPAAGGLDKQPTIAKPAGKNLPKTAANDAKIAQLAKKYANVTGRAVMKFDMSVDERVAVIQEVDDLDTEELSRFNLALSAYSTAPAHAHP